MKKLLFGLGLLISGVIGFAGWSIAVTLTVPQGMMGTVFQCFYRTDWVVLAVFAVMAAAGLALSVKEVRKGSD